MLSWKTTDRPECKLPLNLVDWLFLCLGFLSVLGLVILWGRTWPNVPDRIPADLPVMLGSPKELLILPILALQVYVIVLVLAAVPADYNYPWKITPENAEASYRLGRRLVFVMAAVVPWIPFAFYLRSVRLVIEHAS